MPSRNDSYEFVRHLGHGGMATVELWRQRLTGLAEQRARSEWGVETTHPELAVAKRVYVGEMDEDSKADAHREVAVLKKLSHPHIVRYFGSWVDTKSDDLIIVQEYCENGDLGHLIKDRQKRKESIAAPQLISWLAQVTHALQYCHKKARILHRDLKPRNIFLSHGLSKLHLGDFGIAKQISRTQSLCQTYIGTQVYMSPEIIRLQKYGLKCDVWSLGVTLYEMCTLRRPFESRDPLQVIQAITSPDGPPPFPLESGYPAELEVLCMAMLEKSPDTRPDLGQLLVSSALLREAVLQVERDIGWTDSLVPTLQGLQQPRQEASGPPPPREAEPVAAPLGVPEAPGAKAASASLLQPPPPPPGAPSRWKQLPMPAQREETRRSVEDAATVASLLELTVRKRELTALLVQAQRTFALAPVPEEVLTPGVSPPRSSCSSRGGCSSFVAETAGGAHVVECRGVAQPLGPASRGSQPTGACTASSSGIAGSSVAVDGRCQAVPACSEGHGTQESTTLGERTGGRVSVGARGTPCGPPPPEESTMPGECTHGRASSGYAGASAVGRYPPTGADVVVAAVVAAGAPPEEDVKQKVSVISARLQCIDVLNDEEPDPAELTTALRQLSDLGLAEEECGKALIIHTHRLRMQAEDVVAQEAAPLPSIEKAAEMLEAVQHVPQGAGVAKTALSQAHTRLQKVQHEHGEIGLRCAYGGTVRLVSVRRDTTLAEATSQIARRLGKPACALALSWQPSEGQVFAFAIELSSEEAWRGCLAQNPSGPIELAVKADVHHGAAAAVPMRRRPPQKSTSPQPEGRCSGTAAGAQLGRAPGDGPPARRASSSQPPCDGPPRRGPGGLQLPLPPPPMLSGGDLAPTRRTPASPQPPAGGEAPPPRRASSSPQLAAGGDALLRRPPGQPPLVHRPVGGSPAAAARAPAGAAAGPGGGEALDLQRVTRVFQRFDSCGRGEIALADLSRVLQMLIPAWTDRNLRAFSRAVDGNGDGRIRYQEFASWLMRSDDGLDEARRAVLAEPQAVPGRLPRRAPSGRRRPLLMQGRSLVAS